MITGLEELTDEQLKQFVLNIKTVMLRVIDMPDAHSAGPKECSPAAMFNVQRLMLEAFEAELFKRGANPFDVEFGTDILGAIND